VKEQVMVTLLQAGHCPGSVMYGYTCCFFKLCQQYLEEVVYLVLFVCLSVSMITAKVISRFLWNLLLWVGLPLGRIV